MMASGDPISSSFFSSSTMVLFESGTTVVIVLLSPGEAGFVSLFSTTVFYDTIDGRGGATGLETTGAVTVVAPLLVLVFLPLDFAEAADFFFFLAALRF